MRVNCLFCLWTIVLCWQGNTAVYLLYAHARICSIIRKSGKEIEDLKKVSFLICIVCSMGYSTGWGLPFSRWYLAYMAFHHSHVSLACSQTGRIVLGHADERILGLHLIRFAEVILVGMWIVCSCYSICVWLDITHDFYVELRKNTNILHKGTSFHVIYLVAYWLAIQICTPLSPSSITIDLLLVI